MPATSASKSQPTQQTPEPTRPMPTYQPLFDILENDSELTLYGDLPGVAEDGLDIKYENDQLTIRGRVASRNEGLELVRQEYGVGDFLRVFAIGEAINADAITAEVRNGELVVHLPKAEVAKPKRIAVKAV